MALVNVVAVGASFFAVVGGVVGAVVAACGAVAAADKGTSLAGAAVPICASSPSFNVEVVAVGVFFSAAVVAAAAGAFLVVAAVGVSTFFAVVGGVVGAEEG